MDGRLIAGPVLCVLALLTGSASTGAPAVAATTAPNFARVDSYLAESLAATRLPGMAVAIVRGEEVEHVAGFGIDGRGDRVTGHTQFRIGSLSKAFTAVAVHRLAEQGRVELDAPVQTYVPDFTTTDPGIAARITVRQLLQQTSGLADAGFPEITGEQPPDLRTRVAQLARARPVSEPGREFHYFEPNYQLLAHVVELVSGVPFGTYLHRHVLTPLGMTRTVAAPTAAAGADAAPDLAPGHILLFGMPIARNELDGLLAGSGGVVSNAQDMARWLGMHASDGAPVLSPESLAQTHTPPAGVAGGYAQGWQVVTPEDGPARLEHTGVLSTYSAVQVLSPDSGYGFVLLFTGNSALADTVGVAAGLAALLDGRPPPGVRGTGPVAVALGVATVALLLWRLRLLAGAPRWRRSRPRPWWIVVPGLVWPLLPLPLLVGLPALLGLGIGRSFTLWQLSLAMPGVLVVLTVAAVTGTALVIVRVRGLIRQGRT